MKLFRKNLKNKLKIDEKLEKEFLELVNNYKTEFSEKLFNFFIIFFINWKKIILGILLMKKFYLLIYLMKFVNFGKVMIICLRIEYFS